MGRKQAREGAMKILYQMELNDDFSEDALDIFLSNFSFDEQEKEYILDVAKKVNENVESIDKYIELYSEGWKINRIAKVDLTVLRIAIYEILYRNDIPMEVAINEAIEIAKKYSTEDSFKFVNGILGGVAKSINK